MKAFPQRRGLGGFKLVPMLQRGNAYSVALAAKYVLQRALAYEMHQAGLQFAREIEQHIFYKNLPEPIGTRRADFIIEQKVLVELKAKIQLEDVHFAQTLNYLKIYRLEVGLLINFGSKSLTFKRLIRQYN